MTRSSVRLRPRRMGIAAISTIFGLGLVAMLHMWPALAALPGRIARSDVAAGAAVGGSVFTGVGVMVTLAARLHREGVPGPGSRVQASFTASVSLLMFPIALIGAAVFVHGLAQPGAS